MYREPKEHEIYYDQEDYFQILKKYQAAYSSSFNPQQLLLVAKAYFIKESYPECLSVIKSINPYHSTKVLFERQSLQFRALFLLKRAQLPEIQHLQKLHNILQIFQKRPKDVAGQPFKTQHFERNQIFKQCILFLEKQIGTKVHLDDKIFMEQKLLQNKLIRHQGFPTYLISYQWIQNFNNAISKDESYLCPLTNFSIVNDIFEAYHYQNDLDKYKNIFVFPGVKTLPISKRYWNYLNMLINQGKEFLPIKRITKQVQLQSQQSTSRIQKPLNHYPLVRIAVSFQSKMMVIQLSQNKHLEQQFYAIIEKEYDGHGQVRIKDNNQQPIYDFEETIQESLQSFDKIIYYTRVIVPNNIPEDYLYPLLRYELSPLSLQILKNPQNGLKGLENIGNSCYLNSCIQCLRFTQNLVKIFLFKSPFQLINFSLGTGVITAALCDIFKVLWGKKSQNRINPRKFKAAFGQKYNQFAQKTQEDAHEFLLCLMNDMHESLKTAEYKIMRSMSKLDATTDQNKVRQYFEKHVISKNRSKIIDLFRGKMHNTMDCSSCKAQSHSYDVFLALTLPVPQKQQIYIDIYINAYETKQTKKKRFHLQNIKDISQLKNYLGQFFKKKIQQPYYVLGQINKQNLTFQELIIFYDSEVVQLEPMTIDKLIQKSLKFDFIMFQTRRRRQKQCLVLLQYRLEKDGLIIGFPHLMLVDQSKIVQSLYFLDLKRQIVENDAQNFFRSYDIDKLSIRGTKQSSKQSSKQKNKFNCFQYVIQVIFREKQKLFKGCNDIFQQINDPNTRYSISECFDLMRKPEVLQNSWKCGNCKKMEKVQKRQLIVQVNEIMIIHLKRFKADYRKISTMIDYPINGLDISPWLEDRNHQQQYKYNLYAVCLHTGTAEYGHYRAYCKHFVSGEWYQFDDSLVNRIQQKQVVTQNAYMLFYKKEL